MSMDHDHHNAVFLYVYWQYIMPHFLLPFSWLKSIMAVWLILVQSQIYIGHILNMIITSWGAN